MDAPNAPNPANPNAQDQFMDAVQGPANQVQGPAKLVKMCPCSLHNNQPQYIQFQWVQWHLPLKYFIKIGKVRNPNSQVNLKRMQNHIFSVLEIGWKPTTSLTKSKLGIFV